MSCGYFRLGGRTAFAASLLRRPNPATNYAFSKLRWSMYAPLKLRRSMFGQAMRSCPVRHLASGSPIRRQAEKDRVTLRNPEDRGKRSRGCRRMTERVAKRSDRVLRSAERSRGRGWPKKIILITQGNSYIDVFSLLRKVFDRCLVSRRIIQTHPQIYIPHRAQSERTRDFWSLFQSIYGRII